MKRSPRKSRNKNRRWLRLMMLVRDSAKLVLRRSVAHRTRVV